MSEIPFEALHILDRMIQLAMADELPEVNTIIVKNVRWFEIGAYKGERTEVSSLQELIDHLTKLANSKEKITNIRISGRLPE